MSLNYNRFTEETIRTAWLKTWATDFLKELAKHSGKNAIESYCLAKKEEFETICQEKSSARNKSEERIETGVGWQNSASTNMSQIRKAIKAWSDYKAEKRQLADEDTYSQSTKSGVVQQHYALLFMNYPPEFHTERMAPTNARKQEQRSDLQPITDVVKCQETIDTLLKSYDYREIAAGLVGATGRRPSEILVTAQFKQLGQFQVEFTGQIKNRDEEREGYSTYTLVESYKVIDALARLRRIPEIKSLKGETLAQVDSSTNNKINSKVKEFFTDLIPPPTGETELSAKNLRAAYAAIAIYLFCPREKSINQFITQNLGHVNDATAASYEDYQVCDDDGKPATKGVWVKRLKEEYISPTEGVIIQPRMKISQAAKNVIDDIDFLPYNDIVSRFDELVRLAKIGKDFENGKLKNEVVFYKSNSSEGEAMQKQTKIKDVTELTNDKLFGSNIPHSGAEKIRRAVEAIKIYNQRQAEAKYQWGINTKSLKDLTGCRTEVVNNYLSSDEGRLNVLDYNLEKGYTYHHNRGKGNIKDFIKLTEAEE